MCELLGAVSSRKLRRACMFHLRIGLIGVHVGGRNPGAVHVHHSLRPDIHDRVLHWAELVATALVEIDLLPAAAASNRAACRIAPRSRAVCSSCRIVGLSASIAW